MTPLFLNSDLQQKFEKYGYVKIPLLSEVQVNELVALFKSSQAEHAEVNTLHHTTTDTQKPELITRVDAAIKRIFVPELEKVVRNFKPLAGCFHIKENKAGSATGIHQDPTFVDETKYYSANAWVALHDMDEHNGNLFFIPGSNKIECLRITPSSPNYYENFQGELPTMAKQVPLKKGEAVIFSNATIHGATDNLSNDLRLAATLLICSEPADWMIYYSDKDTPKGKIEKYVLDLNSFVTMAKDGRPNRDSFKEYIHYNFPKLTKEEFVTAAGIAKPKAHYLQRIKNVFKRSEVI